MIAKPWSAHPVRRLVLAVGFAVAAGWIGLATAQAGQSLFWLQTDGTTSQLGSTMNPEVNLQTGQTVPLYLWVHKDAIGYGFDGVSFDVKLISSDGGTATATITFDNPTGRWDGVTGGGTRTDSGGVGVAGCNAIDLTNTDTLTSDPIRLATINVTGVTGGTVQILLCSGAMGVIDGGDNAVIWLGLADTSTAPDMQYINGGIPGMCSAIPEATINVIAPYRGDFDHDDDIDQTDFGHLQNCLTGSVDPLTDPACADANLNGDPFVDDSDLLLFVQCMAGPDALPPSNCH